MKCETMLSKCEVEFSGSHPDSLYRVPTMGNGVGGGPWTHGAKRLRSSCRFLKWPLALTALCIGLALLVYFLMPDINPPRLVSEKVNSTEWQQDEMNTLENAMNKSSEDDKHILQFDFVDDGTNNENVLNKFVELLKKVEPTEEENVKPLPPIFPVNISPSVQYGNENQDSNEQRTPKKPLILHPSTDAYDDKFPTQTFAIFYNKDAALDTTTSNSAESKERKTYESQPTFTSGHQNSFGIPIEETERLKTTTQSAIYNTKVSPTLPSMVDKNRIRSTTVRSRWNTTEDGICHSTRLSMCRGVLPYDLTTLPLVTGITTFQELDTAVPYFDYILKSGCSPRARQFVCSLLEPECKPKGMKILPPCRRACKAIAESCQDIISASPELSQVFNCQQYPEHSSECVTLARGAHCLSGELRCPVDGSCVPSHWRCDNISDCPGGTDELNCDDQSCAPSEFRCGDRNSCIPEEWVCDGHQDCIGAEDEASCGLVGESDVISAASYHPRPALMLRPKLRLQPQPTVSEPSVTSKAPQEYDNSKELLMMSDSVMPMIKSMSRKMPESSTTPKPYQVISSSTSVTSSSSNCPKYDPNCRRNKVSLVQSSGCIKGVNCTSNENIETTTTEKIVSTTKNVDSDSISSGTSHSSPCPQGELRCVDGRCITLAQLCDHQKDCSDGADEANCFT